jgi:SagB-type dehydrogenase family enzyme
VVDAERLRQAHAGIEAVIEEMERIIAQRDEMTRREEAEYGKLRAFMRERSAGGGLSEQMRGVEPPSLQKEAPVDAPTILLPAGSEVPLQVSGLRACIEGRRSRRKFDVSDVGLEELAYLLWATQGVRKVVGGGYATLRMVPSGGARHPFETYLAVQRVAGLEPGLYRYQGIEHRLLQLRRQRDLVPRVMVASGGQEWIADAAVVFLWSCIPYRAEWRYMTRAHRAMLLDAGHICQNLYLACESLGLGTCAIAAYDQQMMDRLLDLDGEEEYLVYLAPVGRPGRTQEM